MSAIKLYRVQINSSEGKMILADTDNATFFHEHLECHSITALTVSIIVINIEGLHSDPVVKTIVMQPLLYGESLQITIYSYYYGTDYYITYKTKSNYCNCVATYLAIVLIYMMNLILHKRS